MFISNTMTGSLFLLITCIYGITAAGIEKKRLLLNDADVILSRLTQLETTVAKMQTSQNTGSTFIRWGRKQCPDNTSELIYSGFAGGSSYLDKGAASEYVCLPPDPNFEKTWDATYTSHMYGAEYEENFFGPYAADEDVPCALCQSLKSTTIMIPAKNVCYNGWTLQYHGYLASGYFDHPAASSYVCVDSNVEWLNAGAANMNGKLFYHVVAKCGSLQCPPYVNDYPLTCVVCSK